MQFKRAQGHTLDIIVVTRIRLITIVKLISEKRFGNYYSTLAFSTEPFYRINSVLQLELIYCISLIKNVSYKRVLGNKLSASG